MKHLATIQFEFLRTARKWNELSLDEQKQYLHKHPKSKRRITAKPKAQNKSDTDNAVETIYHGITSKIDSYDGHIATAIKNEDIERFINYFKNKDFMTIDIRRAYNDELSTGATKGFSMSQYLLLNTFEFLKAKLIKDGVKSLIIDDNTAEAISKSIKKGINNVKAIRQKLRLFKNEIRSKVPRNQEKLEIQKFKILQRIESLHDAIKGGDTREVVYSILNDEKEELERITSKLDRLRHQ